MTRQEIIELARAIVANNGGQVAVADALGVTQPRISQALRDDKGSDGIRIRILTELGNLTVTEVFEVSDAEQAPRTQETKRPRRDRTQRGR